MESIKSIYRIGHGPSSSHTMGPHLAAEQFRQRTPTAQRYRVTLFGSLAATGKGHLTDKTIAEALAPAPVTFVWKPEIIHRFHTNAMFYEAFGADGGLLDSWTVYSIGGGALSDGHTEPSAHRVYEHNTITEILKHIEQEGMTFWEYAEKHEDPDLWDYLQERWDIMQATIERGLQDDRAIPGGLHLQRKAPSYYVKARSYKPSLQGRCLVSAYALATAEENASGGVIVTAPTCGSAGVLPAVLYHLKHSHDFSDKAILKAMATAALFGNVIKTNASISGAEVGCQGEIGSACSMASAAASQLFGGTPRQIEYAAEMGLEHHLGLTCDPVCGLVQIPCIERNSFAALRALDANLFSMLSDGKHIISFDKVVKTMNLTGKDLPSLYKETSAGGLALVDRED